MDTTRCESRRRTFSLSAPPRASHSRGIRDYGEARFAVVYFAKALVAVPPEAALHRAEPTPRSCRRSCLERSRPGSPKTRSLQRANPLSGSSGFVKCEREELEQFPEGFAGPCPRRKAGRLGAVITSQFAGRPPPVNTSSPARARTRIIGRARPPWRHPSTSLAACHSLGAGSSRGPPRC